MIAGLRITILVDNRSIIGEEYAPGGFSALVECFDETGAVKKILFDTGPDGGILMRNTERLGIDLLNVEYIVISHGHFDHTGGLAFALSEAANAKVICHSDALIEKVLVSSDGSERPVGVPVSEELLRARDGRRIIESSKPYHIAEDIWTTGEVPRTNDFERLNDTMKEVVKRHQGMDEPDTLIDDQSLIIALGDGRKIVLCGCCHAGIVNTLDHIRNISDGNIVGIIGGLQLHEAADTVLAQTGEALKRYPLDFFYPMHSTGDRGIDYFRNRMPGVFGDGGVGRVIEIESLG